MQGKWPVQWLPEESSTGGTNNQIQEGWGVGGRQQLSPQLHTPVK